MPNDRVQLLQQLQEYHFDCDSLYHPERGPSIFGVVAPPSVACICAELSRLAYIRFDQSAAELQRLKDSLAAGGFGEPKTFSSGGSQAFAVRKEGQAFVAFRGSQPDDFKDLLSDARFLPVKRTGYQGRVAAGFSDALELLWPELVDWLDDVPSAHPPVFTGHSLGAALATLAAARISHASLVTFGSPRVGNEEFAASFATRSVERFVDCCDLVTAVPLEVGFGHKHVGLPTYIDRDGKIQRPLPSTRAIEADTRLGRWWYHTHIPLGLANVPFRDLADHAPANYIRALLAP